MEVFLLSLLICRSTVDDGLLMSRQCRWEQRDYFEKESVCQVNGAAEIGKGWHSWVLIPNSEEKVESHRCLRIGVRSS